MAQRERTGNNGSFRPYSPSSKAKSASCWIWTRPWSTAVSRCVPPYLFPPPSLWLLFLHTDLFFLFKLLHQADFTIPVEIEGTYHNVYVIKRPGVDQFMKRVGELYEVVVFTASVSKVRLILSLFPFSLANETVWRPIARPAGHPPRRSPQVIPRKLF